MVRNSVRAVGHPSRKIYGNEPRPVSTHLTRPLRGCRLRDCGAPDCPTCYGSEAARLYREQKACDHDEHDHGICIEDAADAREDR